MNYERSALNQRHRSRLQLFCTKIIIIMYIIFKIFNYLDKDKVISNLFISMQMNLPLYDD